MIADVETRPNTFQQEFEAHTAYFQQTVRHTDAGERLKKLKKLKKWILSNEDAIRKAAWEDFRKQATETDISEILPVISEIKDAISNLRTWMRPKRVSTPLSFFGTSARVEYVPKGVCLIISPWNFPFMLAVGPLVSAIAAGCVTMLKPSEMTPATAELLGKMAKEVFDPREVSVHPGDHLVAGELLKLPFNHIFFTGSPQVGKIVMKAAAENLTSVTLELGGLNPVIVDETAGLKAAARRIIWAKMFNTGQACVAPNNIYVHSSVYERFLGELKAAVEHIYGDPKSLQNNQDYARIVNERHFTRVKNLLDDATEKGARLVFGGKTDAETCYVEPTILADVPANAAVMEEEIFAPLIAVIPYTDLTQVVKKINALPDSLSLYVFSKRQKNIRYVLENTQSGTTAVNEVVAQFLHPHLPFGGHNHSGIGKAHGHYGFMAFTSERSLLRKSFPISSPTFLFPPYNKFKKLLVYVLIRYL